MATLKPHSNKGHDLGDSSTKWGTVHSGDLQTETLTASGNVEIQGNLTVTGSQIVATVDTVEAKDPLISLAKDNTADTFDIGFYGKSVDGSSSTKYHGIVRDADDSGKFKVFKDASSEPGTTVGAHSVATVVADLEVPSGSSLKVPNSAGALVDYITAVNLGTAAASKVLVLDSNKDISGIATLTAQTLSAGNITLNGSDISVAGGGSPKFTSIDVDGGAIDGTPIGENAQSSAKFTTLNASGVATFDGSVTLGNTNADDISIPGRLITSVVPKTDGDYDLGSDSLRMRHVYSDQITASTISGFSAGGPIDFKDENLTNVDIDSGAIDGVVIGASSAGAITATNLIATGNVDLGDADSDTLTINAKVDSDVIPTGTVDLGSTDDKWAEAHITAVKAETLEVSGNVDLGDASSDTLTIVASIDSNIVPEADGTRSLGSSTNRWAHVHADDLTVNNLTQNRVVLAGADGQLADDSGLTFSSDTLTATKIGQFEAAGAINFANQAMTNVDINSGAIDGVTIATSNITVGSGKTLDVSAGTITFAAGQIANVSLANDSVSFGGVSLDLGQSDATPAFDLSDATNYPTSSLVGTVTNAQLAGSIEDSKLNTITTSNKVSGSAVQLNSTHSAIEDSTGLRLKATLAGDGLALADQVLSVNVDDSSIETDSDTLRIKAEGITNDMLAGSIANAKLSNSAVTITAGSGLQTGGSVSLGSSVTINSKVDGSSIEVDSVSNELQVKAAGITNAMLAGSIENSKLSNSTVSFGGVEIALGASDATPAFDLTDATNYPTSSLTGTITNAQLAGSIANAKLANSTISGVALGSNLNNLTVDDSSIKLSSGTTYNGSAGLTISVKDGGITNAMLNGSIENGKLSNSTVSFGGVSLALGASDATPAFDLADATNYPTSSLVGTITNAQLAGSIANAKLANSTLNLSADSGSSDVVNLGESITFAGGDSVSTVVSDNTITINADDATGSSKGVASFHSDDFTVSSGMVQIASESVSNTQLAGSISDGKLNQISAADKVALSALAISSETAEVTDLDDSDLFIVKNANGTNSKVEASKLKAYSQAAVSVTDAGGDGSLAYDNSTGVITYTGPSASEVRAHITAGTGVTISSGEVAIGQAVGTTDDVSFKTVTIDSVEIDGTDAAKIDGITNGTAAANKAVVLGANKEIATLGSVTAGTFTDGTASLTSGNLTGLLKAQVDNVEINGNTIKSTSGNLTLDAANGSVFINYGDSLTIRQSQLDNTGGSVDIEGTLTTDAVVRNVSLKTGNYTFDNSGTPNDHIILFDASSAGGNLTFTLPAANDEGMAYRECIVKNVGSSNNVIISSSSTIDATSTTLVPGGILKVISTTQKWCQI